MIHFIAALAESFTNGISHSTLPTSLFSLCGEAFSSLLAALYTNEAMMVVQLLHEVLAADQVIIAVHIGVVGCVSHIQYSSSK